MKRFFQKLFYGAPVGDPVFTSGGIGNGVELRPVSGRRAAALSLTNHGETSAVVLETDDLKELQRSIEYILTMEQRT